MFSCFILAEVQVHIRQEGVGVPEFLNEPWTVTDQRIVVNVTEGRHGLLLTLIARDSLTHAQITRFREVAGDPDNLFTVTVNGESKSYLAYQQSIKLSVLAEYCTGYRSRRADIISHEL